MFTKITLLLLMCLMLMGASNCSSRLYLPPQFEDCMVITTWSPEHKTDYATCFCLDDRIKKDNFEALVLKVTNVLNEHPLQTSALEYLANNKEYILTNKEYELPISYCRGYSALSPTDRTSLTKWGEENRMGRIRCELATEEN